MMCKSIFIISLTEQPVTSFWIRCFRHSAGDIEHVASIRVILSAGKIMYTAISVQVKVQLWQNHKPATDIQLKSTLVQALRLCKGRTAHMESRGIALLFHDHGTRRGWGIRVTPWHLFTPGKDSIPIVQEAGSAPGPVWTGAENFAPTRIRSPDRPGRS